MTLLTCLVGECVMTLLICLSDCLMRGCLNNDFVHISSQWLSYLLFSCLVEGCHLICILISNKHAAYLLVVLKHLKYPLLNFTVGF